MSGAAVALEDSSDRLVTEDIFFSDIPVTLTPSRIEQPATEVPMSVTTIDRNMIEASGATTLAEVFRLVPGMQMTYVNGAFPLVTYHGLSDEWSRRLQVQIDGRSIYLPLFSSVDWTNQVITLDEVERIEVIRGSNAPVYGSNAFIGVINIITRIPIDMQGGFVKLSTGLLDARSVAGDVLNGEMGRSVDGINASSILARYAGIQGKWEYVSSLNYKTDSGFDRMHDTQEIVSGFLRTIYTPTPFDRLDMQFGMSGGGMGSGVADGGVGFTFERPRDVLSHYQSVGWSHGLSSHQEVSLRAYHNYYEQHDQYNIGKVSEAMSGGGISLTSADVTAMFEIEDLMVQYAVNDNAAERFDMELEYQIQASKPFRINFVSGLGMRLDRFKSRWLIREEGYVSDLSERAFGSINWSIVEPLSLHLGAMLEHNEIVGSYVSPRLGATLRLGQHQALRFGLTRGVRTPSLLEANVYHSAQLIDGTDIVVIRIHSDDLRSEKLTSAELGYLMELPKVNTMLDVKIFHEKYEDLIYTANDYGFEQPTTIAAAIATAGQEDIRAPFLTHNGTNATIYGFEAQIKSNVSTFASLAFTYGYAKMDGQHLRFIDSPEFPEGMNYENVSSAVPEHTLSMLASMHLPWKFRLSSALYHLSDMRWIGDGSRVSGYNRWDMVLNRGFRFASVRGEVNAKLLNITDSYREFRSTNEFKTRAYLDMSLSF